MSMTLNSRVNESGVNLKNDSNFQKSGIKQSHEFIHHASKLQMIESRLRHRRVQQQKVDRFSRGMKRSNTGQTIAIQCCHDDYGFVFEARDGICVG